MPARRARVTTVTIHASPVAIDGHAVLIAARSGAGKSDLALRLIDGGAALVSDDYTVVRRDGERLLASPPANIVGKIEARGVGILTLPHVWDVPVRLFVDLDSPVERLPDPRPTRVVAGLRLPAIALRALEASAPAKVRLALAQPGPAR